MIQPPPIAPSLLNFAAVDEGLDCIIRVPSEHSALGWKFPLKGKSRTLQTLKDGSLLAVTERGYIELSGQDGSILGEVNLFPSGVISAERLGNGGTFLGGLNLGRSGITFLELDLHNQPIRSVAFAGDYVRRSTITPADTILFTCDDHVCEGDWSGKILRKFSASGFKHAWKAQRIEGDRTLITAGYGAFAVELESDGRLVRHWECTQYTSEIRPFFFGDFERLDDGSLLICNWLGHGTDLGGTGYSLLHFAPSGKLLGAWRDPLKTSSLQTFARF